MSKAVQEFEDIFRPLEEPTPEMMEKALIWYNKNIISMGVCLPCPLLPINKTEITKADYIWIQSCGIIFSAAVKNHI